MTAPDKLTVEQVGRENADDLSWFIRNADRSNPCAFINTNPTYFADECATYFSHRQQAEARAEGLMAALESIKWKSADRDNMEFSARITFCQMDGIRDALTAYRSGKTIKDTK